MPLNPNIGPSVSSLSYINSALRPYEHKFNIAHLNCQSIKPSINFSKVDELRSILIGSFINLFAITETWLKPYVSSRSVEISGYKFIRNDRLNSRGGGVGIYIANGLKYRTVFRISEIGSCESLFIELCCNELTFLFGVVYLPHGDLASFENFHSELFLRYSNIIVVGDFNNNLFDISNSSLVRAMCLRNNLSVVHNSKPSHYNIAHRSTSLIDFWLVSNISMVCSSFQVQCPLISHHALLIASFEIRVDRVMEFVEYSDFNLMNWDDVHLALSTFDFSCFYFGSVNDKCSCLASLFDLIMTFVPTVRKNISNLRHIWMNSNEILYAKSLCRLAYCSYMRNRSDSNWRVYCKYRNKAKNVMRRVKRNYFSKLFRNMDNRGMWRVFKQAGYLDNGRDVFDVDVDALNDFFVGSNVSVSEDMVFDGFAESVDSFSFHCVTELDVFDALTKVKSKALGADNISIRLINLLYPFISDYILDLFNTVLTTSTFPTSWKTAKVVPIPKSRVTRELGDFRPISILPALSKVLEHIIRKQMLESSFLRIYEGQYAFRRGFNTTSMLLSLTDYIRKYVNDDKLSVLISLDLSNAFGSISYSTMVRKLRHEYNFSRSACKLIFSYLVGRSQFVKYNGFMSALRYLSFGIPQGSVLGPLLFILYVNDLPANINSPLCRAFMYADDIFLLFKGCLDSCDVLENNINFCLDQVREWTSHNCLELNPSKSKAIMFGPTNRFFPDIDIVLNNFRIQLVDNLKCLGLVLDSHLSFDHHIDLLYGKIFFILRKIHSTGLYLPLRVRYILAYASLMSLLLYGLEVYSGTCSTRLRKVNRLVNSVVRFVYNVRRREHISDFVRSFLGCTFVDFIKYRLLILFHGVIQSGRPPELCAPFVFTRSVRNPQLRIPRISSSFFERSFVVRIARLWNILPYSLRNFSQSKEVFSLRLLEFLSSSTS